MWSWFRARLNQGRFPLSQLSLGKRANSWIAEGTLSTLARGTTAMNVRQEPRCGRSFELVAEKVDTVPFRCSENRKFRDGS
jgi:hypothetical protein